jgi:putative aldouronate transport system permease protein
LDSTALPAVKRKDILSRNNFKNRFELLDVFLLLFLTVHALIIVLPFISVIATSFATHREYLDSSLLLIPKAPTLENYTALFEDGRIWIGYRTTSLFLLFGVPLNMVLTTTVAYALSRPRFPGKRFFLYFIVFTMLFNGGIIPMYLLMKELDLTNKVMSVVLAYGVNTFYMIIMRNYFSTLPESLIESAKLDGASELKILIRIILPLSMPIIATILLFYTVDRWNEWFNAMIFIRKNNLISLQLVLRSIFIESRMTDAMSVSDPDAPIKFTDGMKTSAVMVTMLPVMCVFPFLQRYFIKGILIGAVKS